MSAQKAEDVTFWPTLCAVCWYERNVTKFATSQKKALRHRRKAHPWLADALGSL